MSRRRRVECPTPSKVVYPDVYEAAVAFHEEESRRPDREVARYAYRCMCGRWHRTKREPHEFPATDLRTVFVAPPVPEGLCGIGGCTYKIHDGDVHTWGRA
jgi:hypothetical protein